MRWGVLFFVWALDVGAAALLSQLDERSDKIFMFLMALVVLWILPLLTGVWGLIKFWIAYHLFLKRKLVRYIKAQFFKNGFPASGAFYDHMDYLSHVMDSDDLDLPTKLKAGSFVGELSTYKSDRPWTMGIAMAMAFQHAMEEYRPESGTQPLI
ncbi:hypothetical protein U8C36_09780 [Sinorhizobium medicae]|uniref:hypothetical protein n=1 Tax=Sinorhizobium medicae TaxID=110321 RepID=UPI002AF6BF6F|nr:hypothetical protein [Sinorhizobium medicae]WQO53839.1 hypothetical protein U8C36_09780 [Sinorhizobium medicae]